MPGQSGQTEYTKFIACLVIQWIKNPPSMWLKHILLEFTNLAVSTENETVSLKLKFGRETVKSEVS